MWGGLDWHPGLCVSGGRGSGGRKGPSSAMSGLFSGLVEGGGLAAGSKALLVSEPRCPGKTFMRLHKVSEAGPWRMAVSNGLGPAGATPLVPVFLRCPALPTCPPFTGLVTSIHQGPASTRCTWRPGVVSVGDRVKGTQAVPSETSRRPTEALRGHTLRGAGRSPG